MFPDYEPKRTPDTIEDYLRGPSKVLQILRESGEEKLANLKNLIQKFEDYKYKAEKNPGGPRPGNVALGADPNQYYPSDEELIVSELGKKIQRIMEAYPKNEIAQIKSKEKIKALKIVFNEIWFRHVDVMGSGRFFYAEKKPQENEISI